MKKREIIKYIFLLTVGIVLLVSSYVMENMPKKIFALCMSIGISFTIISLVNISLFIYLNKRPMIESQKDIDENDERNIYIEKSAKAKSLDLIRPIMVLMTLLLIYEDSSLLVILTSLIIYLLGYIIQLFYIKKFHKEM